MKKILGIFVGVLLACILSLPADATIIRENTAGTLTGSVVYWGQSVVTPSDGPWNNLQFNFFSADGPLAFGNLYLLGVEYLGTPNALSSLTPGFIALAADAGDTYLFDPSVTIQSDTQYWFYTDATQASSLIGGTASGVPGESHYFSTGVSSNFAGPYVGLNFTLQSASVPEPSTLLLLGSGLIGLGFVRRRFRG